jgi:hypothetical protein
MSNSNVEFEVGGLYLLQFEPGCRTGSDPETQPGIGFDLISNFPAREYNGKFHCGGGVNRRKDAVRLRDMLSDFLELHA